MCGRLAYDSTFNEMGLPSVARECFEKGTLKELVDLKLKEDDENFNILNEGVNQHSLDIFSKIAYQCLAESQSERPNIGIIIKELEKALYFQKSNEDNLHISLEEIKLATQNFNTAKCIGEGRYWKHYEGHLSHATVNNGEYVAVIAKRFDSRLPQGRHQFFIELKVLYKFKHENIVSLVGYCNEMDEIIVVYEHPINGRLDKHLDNANLTWMRRLKICIDIACGLDFLHTGGVRGEISTIHRDIKTSSILLDSEWKAKISNLELSSPSLEFKEIEHLNDNAYGSLNYVCPTEKNGGFLFKESDVYSLGVVLVDIFSGRLSWGDPALHSNEHNLQRLVYPGIEEQIDPNCLAKFLRTVLLCLDEDVFDRPEASVVVRKLMKAMEFQEDDGIWGPKLPVDYKEIIQTSRDPDTYNSIKTKKKLYNKFCDGILVDDDKVLFSLGSNGARNEMISARKFSYINCRSVKWRFLQVSRFHKAAKMFDLSKLMIEIKITTQFLSQNVDYGVYLVFKFCETRKLSSKPLFVVYVEGIEFRAIDDVKYKQSHKIKEDQQVLKSKSDEYQLFSQNEGSGKKYFMLSAKEVLYDFSMERFHSEPTELRFLGVIELPTQQVFRISCEIQSQMLSLDTKYFCYLVFKLSDKCRGLHCPVKVRDLLHRNNKEAEIIYFRSPSSWNLHDINSVPKQREDGWMEVKVWKFISNHDLEKDYIKVNMKLITYEGTMSGLIVRGLEIRSM